MYLGFEIFGRDSLNSVSRQDVERCSPRRRKHRIDLITWFQPLMFTIIVEIPRSALRLPTPTVCRFALSRLSRPIFYLREFKLRRAAFRSFRPDEDPIALGRWDKRQADKFHFALFFTAFPLPPPVLWPRHSPCRSIPLSFHLRRMILLDYTITTDRLCLTFGSARKWDSRLPTSSDLRYVRDDISQPAPRIRLTVNPIADNYERSLR